MSASVGLAEATPANTFHLAPAASIAARPAALELDDLQVAYRLRGQNLPVLSGVNLTVARGEAYGLVGESGCGKSTVALAVQRALPSNGRITGGAIRLNGRDLAQLSDRALRDVRARDVAMVYQDPGRALNPSLTVGRQVVEVFEILGIRGAEAHERALAILARVRIAGPARVMASYPHQLSGGMQQRVVIAMALAKDPTLLILDEPTTGLDATIEAEVLDLVRVLRREFNAAVLFISHNLAAIAGVCDRVGVLYAGHLVEEAAARPLFRSPRHPYTAGLLRCIPRVDQRKGAAALDTIPGFPPAPGSITEGCVFAPRCGLVTERCRIEAPPLYPVGPGHRSRCHHHDQVDALPRVEPRPPAGPPPTAGTLPALELTAVCKTYTVAGTSFQAVRDVSLTLPAGQTLGIVGESGSGKTTLAHLILGRIEPDPGGRIVLDGGQLAGKTGDRGSEQVKAVQIVFQNPDSALNRAHTVRRLLGRAVHRLSGLRGRAQEGRVVELLNAVRLTARQLPSRPRQLSGGMKQRVAIARAFAGRPRVVVCDEPTSALDVSVQSAILNLLAELQRERGVGYVLISHDLGVVRYLADRIAVLYLGRLMEVGSTAEVLDGPHAPYTEALLSAVPTLEGERGDRIRLPGEIPSPLKPPPGCVFQTRCPRKIGPICETEEPALRAIEGDHLIRCHLPRDQLGRRGPDGMSVVPLPARAAAAQAA